MDWQDDYSVNSTNPFDLWSSTNVNDLSLKAISKITNKIVDKLHDALVVNQQDPECCLSRRGAPKHTYGRTPIYPKFSIKEQNRENFCLNQLDIKYENPPYAPRKIRQDNFSKPPSPFKSPDKKEPRFHIFSTPVAAKKTQQKNLSVKGRNEDLDTILV